MVSSVPRKRLKRRFEFLVDFLRAADETHAGQAEAPFVERVLGGGDDCRVVREAEVVVGAQVEHLPAVGDGDIRVLRAGDDAFGLVEAALLDLGELLAEMGFKGDGHRAIYATAPVSPMGRRKAEGRR